MNKEEFENKAEQLFKKYCHNDYGGDLVLSENSFDYVIEQLSENLIIRNSSLQLKKKRETNSQTWEEISIEELKERIRK